MTESFDTTANGRVTDRREFIGQFAASAIVLASTACAHNVSADPAPGPSAPAAPRQSPAPPVHWDDSWTSRLTAKHKAVFDSADVDEGLALSHAAGYVRGMHDALGAGSADVQAVVVIRHAAIPMIFNDAMWTKYNIGEERKIKQSESDKWATRNEYIGKSASSTGASDSEPARASTDRPQPTLTWLASHGHILLGCDQATRGVAAILAHRAKVDQKVVYEDLKANLVPGVILQPTGVYAALRAQEVGCAYIRST